MREEVIFDSGMAVVGISESDFFVVEMGASYGLIPFLPAGTPWLDLGTVFESQTDQAFECFCQAEHPVQDPGKDFFELPDDERAVRLVVRTTLGSDRASS